ncbi:MAG TPA: hypothetical protein VF646_18945 [Cytophagales bacterium]|jgi:hypothetical protein
MFRQLRSFVDFAVDKTAVVAKVTVEVATGLSAVAVAETVKHIKGGDNPVSDRMWQLGRKVSDRMCNLVDDARPIAKAVVKTPIRQAERLCEVGQGVAQVMFTEQKKEGYEKIENALIDMAAVMITAGIAGAAMEYVAEPNDASPGAAAPEVDISGLGAASGVQPDPADLPMPL